MKSRCITPANPKKVQIYTRSILGVHVTSFFDRPVLPIHDIEHMLWVIQQNQEVDLSKVFEASRLCQLVQVLTKACFHHRVVDGAIGIHGLKPGRFEQK